MRELAGRARPRALWAAIVRRKWTVVAVIACLALLAPMPYAWLVLSTRDARVSAAGDAPSRPVALVLGAGLTPTGRPTPFLAHRLDIAADLYATDRVRAVLVSGDNSRDDYDETGAMRDYLVDAGVPKDKIAGDHAGFGTWDSCVRAREIFGVDAATVVTQGFHLPRAVAVCRRAGIDTAGVGDPSQEYRPSTTVYGYAREVPAAFKAAADMLTRPDPHFLGPKEDGIAKALR